MSLFKKWKKRDAQAEPFDREKYIPVIRASICNGEQVFGWKDKDTGKFQEVEFLKNGSGLEAILEKYGISREEIKKEW